MAALPHFDIPWDTLGIRPNELRLPGIPKACDHEVKEFLTRSAWDEYTREFKRKGKEVIWNESLPIREAPYENGCGRGTAQITSWRSNNGDRLELWSLDGEGGDLEGDIFVALELHTGETLIVGCMTCHPFVASNLVGFNNSDGSSKWEPLQGNSASELVGAVIQRATTYLFRQCH
eukprot:m.42056 g.42056  ORF g.42056 m.42056 type:complete len:176 (+) comp9838_c0_seq1:2115-2642(+)